MPVEIREVIIRTEIESAEHQYTGISEEEKVNRLKREILNQVRKMLLKEQKKRHNRI